MVAKGNQMFKKGISLFVLSIFLFCDSSLLGQDISGNYLGNTADYYLDGGTPTFGEYISGDSAEIEIRIDGTFTLIGNATYEDDVVIGLSGSTKTATFDSVGTDTMTFDRSIISEGNPERGNLAVTGIDSGGSVVFDGMLGGNASSRLGTVTIGATASGATVSIGNDVHAKSIDYGTSNRASTTLTGASTDTITTYGTTAHQKYGDVELANDTTFLVSNYSTDGGAFEFSDVTRSSGNADDLLVYAGQGSNSEVTISGDLGTSAANLGVVHLSTGTTGSKGIIKLGGDVYSSSMQNVFEKSGLSDTLNNVSQLYEGDLTLTSNVILDSSSASVGEVIVSGKVTGDAGTETLTITTDSTGGEIELLGGVSSVGAITLTAGTAAGDIQVDGDLSSSGNQSYTGEILLNNDVTNMSATGASATIVINDDVSAQDDAGVEVYEDLLIDAQGASGSVTLKETVGVSVSSDQRFNDFSVSGTTINLGDGTGNNMGVYTEDNTSDGANQTYTGGVVLEENFEASTGSAGTIVFSGTINAETASSEEDLNIDKASHADLSLATIGGTNKLGTLTVGALNTEDVKKLTLGTVSADVVDVHVGSDGVVLKGNITTAGTLGVDIKTLNSAGISVDENIVIDAGSYDVSLNDVLVGIQDQDLGDPLDETDDVAEVYETVSLQAGSGTITLKGMGGSSYTRLGGLTVGTASDTGKIQLTGASYMNAGDQTYNIDVELTDNVETLLEAGGTGIAGSIILNEELIGDTDGASNLEDVQLIANKVGNAGGEITLRKDIGASTGETRLTDITVSADALEIGTNGGTGINIYSEGNQTYNVSSVLLQEALMVKAGGTGDNVDFSTASIDSATGVTAGLTFGSIDELDLSGAVVGSNRAVGAVKIGSDSVAGNITTIKLGDISGSSVLIEESGSGAISLQGDIVTTDEIDSLSNNDIGVKLKMSLRTDVIDIEGDAGIITDDTTDYDIVIDHALKFKGVSATDEFELDAGEGDIDISGGLTTDTTARGQLIVEGQDVLIDGDLGTSTLKLKSVTIETTGSSENFYLDEDSSSTARKIYTSGDQDFQNANWTVTGDTTLNAGTAGTVYLGTVVGGSDGTLEDLVVDSAQTVELKDAISGLDEMKVLVGGVKLGSGASVSSKTIRFDDDVELQGTLENIASSTGNGIILGSSSTDTITVKGDVTIDTSAGTNVSAVVKGSVVGEGTGDVTINVGSGTGEFSVESGGIGTSTGRVGGLTLTNGKIILDDSGVYSANNQDYSAGDVLIEGNSTFDSTSGNISFGDLDGDTDATKEMLTVTASSGDVTFSGVVSDSIGAVSVTTGNVTVSGAMSTSGAIDMTAINDITVSSNIKTTGGVDLDAGGALTLTGDVGGSSSRVDYLNVTGGTSLQGTVYTDRVVSTNSSDDEYNVGIYLDGEVTVTGATTLDVSNSKHISFEKDVHGSSGATDTLTINASGGEVRVADDIGSSSDRLQSVTISAGELKLGGDVLDNNGTTVYTSGAQSYQAVEVVKNATFNSSTGGITFGSTLKGDNDSDKECLTIDAGTQTVTFSGSLGEGSGQELGAISVSAGTLSQTSTVESEGVVNYNVSGNTTVSGAITGAGLDIKNQSTISANITTTGQISSSSGERGYGQGVVLGNDGTDTLTIGSSAVTIDTDSTTDYDIYIHGAIEGSIGNDDDLTLEAGDADVTVKKKIGGIRRLGTLVVDADRLELGENNAGGMAVQTEESQTFKGKIDIRDNATFDANNANITFEDNVYVGAANSSDLTVDAGTGNVDFKVGLSLETGKDLIDVLSVTSSGTIKLKDGIQTDGGQTYTGNVELQNAQTIKAGSTGSGADIRIKGELYGNDDGASDYENMTLTAYNEDIFVEKKIGKSSSSNQRVGSVTVTADELTLGDSNTDAMEIHSQLGQTYTVTEIELEEDITLSGGSTSTIDFGSSSIEGSTAQNEDLTVTAVGTVDLEDSTVGGTTAIGDMTIGTTATVGTVKIGAVTGDSVYVKTGTGLSLAGDIVTKGEIGASGVGVRLETAGSSIEVKEDISITTKTGGTHGVRIDDQLVGENDSGGVESYENVDIDAIGGKIILGAGVGGTGESRIGNLILTTTGTDKIELDGNITTKGTQSIEGGVVISENTTFTSDNSNISFDSTVKGKDDTETESFTVNAGNGNLTLTGLVGGSSEDAGKIKKVNLTAGTVNVNGGITAESFTTGSDVSLSSTITTDSETATNSDIGIKIGDATTDQLTIAGASVLDTNDTTDYNIDIGGDIEGSSGSSDTLELTAGTADVVVRGDRIGDTEELSSLSVTSGNFTFGQDSNSITSPAKIKTSGNQTYSATVALEGHTQMFSSGGNITLSNNIAGDTGDSDAESLVLESDLSTGSIVLSGTVSGIGSLKVDATNISISNNITTTENIGNSGNVGIELGVNTTQDTTIAGGVTLTTDSTTDYQVKVGGDILGSAGATDTLTVDVGTSKFIVGGSIGAGTNRIQLLTVNEGTTELGTDGGGGSSIHTTGTQSYQAVVLKDNVSFDTSNSNISFNSTVIGNNDSTDYYENLTVDSGTANITFSGNVGGATEDAGRVGEVDLAGNLIKVESSASIKGQGFYTGSNVEMIGSIEVLGELSSYTGRGLIIGDASTDTLTLKGATTLSTDDGVDDDTDYGMVIESAITQGNSGSDTLTLKAGDSYVAVKQAVGTSTSRIESLTLSSGELRIGQDGTSINVYTDGTQTYTGDVVLNPDATFDADNSNITFSGSVKGNDDSTDYKEDFTVDSGTGNITISGTVGGTAENSGAIDRVHLTAQKVIISGQVKGTSFEMGSGTDLDLSSSITTDGETGLNSGIGIKVGSASTDELTIKGASSLITDDGISGNTDHDIIINSAIIAGNDGLDTLTVDSGEGNIYIKEDIGTSVAKLETVNLEGNLIQLGSGSGSNTVYTDEDQDYVDEVLLTNDYTFEGNDISFTSTVKGQDNSDSEDLTIKASGGVTIAGQVGASTEDAGQLDKLDVQTGTSVTQTGSVIISGNVLYGVSGTSTVSADVTANAIDVKNGACLNTDITTTGEITNTLGDRGKGIGVLFGNGSTDTAKVTGATTINSSSSYDIEFQGKLEGVSGSTDTLTLDGKSIYLKGSVGQTNALESLEVNTGTSYLGTDGTAMAVAVSGTQSYQGIVLQESTTLSSASNGTITLGGTVLGGTTSDEETVTISTGSTGQINIKKSIGQASGSQKIDSISLTGGSLDLGDSNSDAMTIWTTAGQSINSADIDLNEDVTIEAGSTATVDLNTGSTEASLDGTTAGTESLIINNASVVDLENVVVGSNVALDYVSIGVGSGNSVVGMTVDDISAKRIQLVSGTNGIKIGGDISASNQISDVSGNENEGVGIRINSSSSTNTVLIKNTSLTQTGNYDIVVDQSLSGNHISGESAEYESLTITTPGDVELKGGISGTGDTRLGAVSISATTASTSEIMLVSGVNNEGDQSYTGKVVIDNTQTLTAGDSGDSYSVTFNDEVYGGDDSPATYENLTINTYSGTVTFKDTVGKSSSSTNRLGDLTVTGSTLNWGETSGSSVGVHTTGSQTYNASTTTLKNDVSMTGGSSGTIQWATSSSSLDGSSSLSEDLTIDTVGTLDLSNTVVGGQVNLGEIEIGKTTSVGTVKLNQLTAKTLDIDASTKIELNGNLTTSGEIGSTGIGVRLDASSNSIVSNQDLTITTNGSGTDYDIQIESNLKAENDAVPTEVYESLTLDSGGADIHLDANIAGTGEDLFGAVHLRTSGSGQIYLNGDVHSAKNQTYTGETELESDIEIINYGYQTGADTSAYTIKFTEEIRGDNDSNSEDLTIKKNDSSDTLNVIFSDNIGKGTGGELGDIKVVANTLTQSGKVSASGDLYYDVSGTSTIDGDIEAESVRITGAANLSDDIETDGEGSVSGYGIYLGATTIKNEISLKTDQSSDYKIRLGGAVTAGNAGGDDLFLDAGSSSIEVTGDIGTSVARLESFVIEGGDLSFSGGKIYTDQKQFYEDNVDVSSSTVVFDTTNSDIDFEGSLTGNTGNATQEAITVNVGTGTVSWDGDIGASTEATGGIKYLDVNGNVSFAGDVTTLGGNSSVGVDVSGTTTIEGATTLDTGSSNKVHLVGDIDGVSGNLDTVSITASEIELEGNIGQTTAIASLTMSSGGVVYGVDGGANKNVTTTQSQSYQAFEVNQNYSLTSQAENIIFNSTVKGENDTDATEEKEDLTITATSGNVEFKGAVGGASENVHQLGEMVVSANSIDVDSTVAVESLNWSGDITVSGSTINTYGELSSHTGQGARFGGSTSDNMTLESDLTVSSDASSDYQVHFYANVNADADSNEEYLTVDSGTKTTTFHGQIGNSGALEYVDVDASGVTFSDNVSAGYLDLIGISKTGTIEVGADISLTSSKSNNSEVTFGEDLNGDGDSTDTNISLAALMGSSDSSDTTSLKVTNTTSSTKHVVIRSSAEHIYIDADIKGDTTTTANEILEIDTRHGVNIGYVHIDGSVNTSLYKLIIYGQTNLTEDGVRIFIHDGAVLNYLDKVGAFTSQGAGVSTNQTPAGETFSQRYQGLLSVGEDSSSFTNTGTTGDILIQEGVVSEDTSIVNSETDYTNGASFSVPNNSKVSFQKTGSGVTVGLDYLKVNAGQTELEGTVKVDGAIAISSTEYSLYLHHSTGSNTNDLLLIGDTDITGNKDLYIEGGVSGNYHLDLETTKGVDANNDGDFIDSGDTPPSEINFGSGVAVSVKSLVVDAHEVGVEGNVTTTAVASGKTYSQLYDAQVNVNANAVLTANDGNIVFKDKLSSTSAGLKVSVADDHKVEFQTTSASTLDYIDLVGAGELSGNMTTSGYFTENSKNYSQRYQKNITIKEDITLNASSTTAGEANIYVMGNIVGETDSPEVFEDLTLDGDASDSEVRIGGTVSGLDVFKIEANTAKLENTVSAKTVDIKTSNISLYNDVTSNYYPEVAGVSNAVETSNDLRGSVTLYGNVDVKATGGDLTLHSTVTSTDTGGNLKYDDYSIGLIATTEDSVGGEVDTGGNIKAKSAYINAKAGMTLSGDSIKTGLTETRSIGGTNTTFSQYYMGEMKLDSDFSFEAKTGDIYFDGRLKSTGTTTQRDATVVASSGKVYILDHWSNGFNNHYLGDIAVTGTTIVFDGGGSSLTQTAKKTMTYTGNVELKDAVTFDTDRENMSFTGSITGDSGNPNLTIDTWGSAVYNATNQLTANTKKVTLGGTISSVGAVSIRSINTALPSVNATSLTIEDIHHSSTIDHLLSLNGNITTTGAVSASHADKITLEDDIVISGAGVSLSHVSGAHDLDVTSTGTTTLNIDSIGHGSGADLKDVTLTSSQTVNLGDSSYEVNAKTLTVNGSNTGVTNLYSDITTVDGQNYNGTTVKFTTDKTLKTTGTNAGLTVGKGIESADDGLTITATGSVSIAKTVDLDSDDTGSKGDLIITSDSLTLGSGLSSGDAVVADSLKLVSGTDLSLYAGVTTYDKNGSYGQYYGGTVTLEKNLTLSANGEDIYFVGEVKHNDSGSEENLTISSTGAIVEFESEVDLGNVNITASRANFSDTLTAKAVTITGSASFQDLDLDSLTVSSNATFNGAIDVSGDIDINGNSTFNSSVEADTFDAEIGITLGNNVITTGSKTDGSDTFGQRYKGAVTLGGTTTTLDSSNKNILIEAGLQSNYYKDPGDDLVSLLDDFYVSYVNNLVINAGTADIEIDRSIGTTVSPIVNGASASLELGTIKMTASDIVLGNSSSVSIKTQKDQTYTGSLSLKQATTLDTTSGTESGDISVTGHVKSATSKGWTAKTKEGNIEVGGTIGTSTTDLGAVVLTADKTVLSDNVYAQSLMVKQTLNGGLVESDGLLQLHGDIKTTGTQTYEGEVQFYSDTDFSSSTSGDIVFKKGLRSADVGLNGLADDYGVAVTGKANVELNEVQAQHVDIKAGSSSAIKLGGNIKTYGSTTETVEGETVSFAQRYQQGVTLVNHVDLETESATIYFKDTIDGGYDLDVNLNEHKVDFEGDLGSTTALGAIKLLGNKGAQGAEFDGSVNASSCESFVVIKIHDDITTSGHQTYHEDIGIGSATEVTLSATGADSIIQIDKAVDHVSGASNVLRLDASEIDVDGFIGAEGSFSILGLKGEEVKFGGEAHATTIDFDYAGTFTFLLNDVYTTTIDVDPEAGVTDGGDILFVDESQIHDGSFDLSGTSEAEVNLVTLGDFQIEHQLVSDGAFQQIQIQDGIFQDLIVRSPEQSGINANDGVRFMSTAHALSEEGDLSTIEEQEGIFITTDILQSDLPLFASQSDGFGTVLVTGSMGLGENGNRLVTGTNRLHAFAFGHEDESVLKLHSTIGVADFKNIQFASETAHLIFKDDVDFTGHINSRNFTNINSSINNEEIRSNENWGTLIFEGEASVLGDVGLKNGGQFNRLKLIEIQGDSSKTVTFASSVVAEEFQITNGGTVQFDRTGSVSEIDASQINLYTPIQTQENNEGVIEIASATVVDFKETIGSKNKKLSRVDLLGSAHTLLSQDIYATQVRVVETGELSLLGDEFDGAGAFTGVSSNDYSDFTTEFENAFEFGTNLNIQTENQAILNIVGQYDISSGIFTEDSHRMARVHLGEGTKDGLLVISNEGLNAQKIQYETENSALVIEEGATIVSELASIGDGYGAVVVKGSNEEMPSTTVFQQNIGSSSLGIGVLAVLEGEVAFEADVHVDDLHLGEGVDIALTDNLGLNVFEIAIADEVNLSSNEVSLSSGTLLMEESSSLRIAPKENPDVNSETGFFGVLNLEGEKGQSGATLIFEENTHIVIDRSPKKYIGRNKEHFIIVKNPSLITGLDEVSLIEDSAILHYGLEMGEDGNLYLTVSSDADLSDVPVVQENPIASKVAKYLEHVGTANEELGGFIDVFSEAQSLEDEKLEEFLQDLAPSSLSSDLTSSLALQSQIVAPSLKLRLSEIVSQPRTIAPIGGRGGFLKTTVMPANASITELVKELKKENVSFDQLADILKDKEKMEKFYKRWGLGAWFKAKGANGEQKRAEGFDGFKQNLWGLTAGFDRKFSEKFIAGIALSQGKASVNYCGKTEGNSLGLANMSTTFYSQFLSGRLRWDSSFTLGADQYDIVRYVSTEENREKYVADTLGLRYSFQNMVYYSLANKVFNQNKHIKRMTLQPYVALNYSYAGRGSYIEEGKGEKDTFALSVAKRSVEVWASELGAKISSFVVAETLNFLPFLSVSWLRNWSGENNNEVEARFVVLDVEDPLKVESYAFEADTIKVDFGTRIEQQVKKDERKWSCGLNYGFSSNSTFQGHDWSLDVRLDF